MSDILRTLALLVPAVAVMAADLTSPSTDLRVNIGLTTPFRNVQANGVDPGAAAPRYDQSIDGAYRGGPHVGLQMLRARVDQEGVGWMWGVELAWDLHRGQANNVDGRPGDFGSDGRMALNALSATFMIGPVFQANLRDLGMRHDAFRVEVGPTAGIGAATATLGSNTSSTGLLWDLGVQMLLTTTFENDVTFTVGGGYEYAQAKVHWDNTDASTATASGVTARVGLGYRF